MTAPVRIATAVSIGLVVAGPGCGAGPSDPQGQVAEQVTARSLPPRLPPSRGGTRYVSPRGSDRAPGTASAPWRTVQRALNTLRPGQTAVIRRGIYRENLVMTRAGRRSAPITVRGERGAVIAAGSGEENNIPLDLEQGAAYLRFRSLVFEGATGPSSTNVYAAHDVHDIELAACEVRGSQRQGFFSEESTSRIQVLGCHFHDNGGSGPAGQDHNIYAEGSRHLIAGNLLTGARNGFGVQLYPSSDRVLVTANTISDNLRDGIVLGGERGTATTGALVVNNIITHSRRAISTYWAGDPGTGNLVRNNLGWANEMGGFGGNGATWAGNRELDPRFRDADAGDYRLRAGSPAIDRALTRLSPPVDITGRRRARGRRADLGAYER